MKTTRNTLIAATMVGLFGSASMAAITETDVTASLESQGFTDITFANASGDAMVVHATRNGAPVTVIYDRDTGDVRTVSANGRDATMDDGDDAAPGKSGDRRQDGAHRGGQGTDDATDDSSDDDAAGTDDGSDDGSDDGVSDDGTSDDDGSDDDNS